MSILTILFILATVIVVTMASYGVVLLLRLQEQKKALKRECFLRVLRLKESIQIIAKSMLSGECNHSEGVLRLRMLLAPLGKQLQQFPAMWKLYEVIQNMPTHEARRELTKNERMHLDCHRENAEAKLAHKIKLEIHLLLSELEQI